MGGVLPRHRFQTIQHFRSSSWKSVVLEKPAFRSRRSCSAATCSAGPPTRRRRSNPRPFFDAGFNHRHGGRLFAWVPGNKGGDSEEIIGKWLKQGQSRDKAVIITKVGSDMGQGKKDLKEQYIIEAVEASLKRLQTDYIDLYLSHWPDAETPMRKRSAPSPS
jgi:hypothetical protein